MDSRSSNLRRGDALAPPTTARVDISIRIDMLPFMVAAAEYDLDVILGRLKAIADEKRLRILSLLAGGERCVCELQDELETGQSLLSHHLKALKDAGLVTDRRDGRWIHYSLNREVLREVEAFLRFTRVAREPVRLAGPCCD